MKTKVLIFIDWFLPGYKAGGPIQSIANLVNHLGSELDISLITSYKDLGESMPYPDLEFNSWQIRENYRVMYLDESHQQLKQYNELMNGQDYDSVYFNSMLTDSLTLLSFWELRNPKSKLILA